MAASVANCLQGGRHRLPDRLHLLALLLPPFLHRLDHVVHAGTAELAHGLHAWKLAGFAGCMELVGGGEDAFLDVRAECHRVTLWCSGSNRNTTIIIPIAPLPEPGFERMTGQGVGAARSPKGEDTAP
jgi:hypothetical protein